MPTHYSVGLLIIAIIDVLDGWQFSTLSRVKLLKTALGIIIIEAYDANLVQANLFIDILFLRNTGCTGVCVSWQSISSSIAQSWVCFSNKHLQHILPV